MGLLYPNIEIQQYTPPGGSRAFVQAAYEVFRDDPTWVRPLDIEMGRRLRPDKNPFFEHAEVALFVASRRGRVLGRASASVDRLWLDTWKDATGHFGFLDTVNDPHVVAALLERVEAWLRSRGMRRVNGPMSFGANEEIGMLVGGFQHPPVIGMAHSRAHQGGFLEALGYRKEKDLWCWKYEASSPFSERAKRAWERTRALPEVRLRSVNTKRLHAELGVVMDIYNETWAGKWGWVPVTGKEIDKMAADMSLVLDPEIAFIAEVGGKPAGMCIAVPNLNEVIADMGGRLLPLNWARLGWRTKVRRPRSTRLIVLGIREDVRRSIKRYGGLSAAMYVEVARRGRARGYSWGELSWTREDDAPTNLGIRSMGATVYKKYRVYEKAL